MINAPKEIGRNNSVDLIKAISILLILYMHLIPVWFEVHTQDKLSIIVILQWIIEYIHFNLAVFAVPLLITSSLYLFHLKSKANNIYIRKRLPRLVLLYLFWTFVQTAVVLVFYSEKYTFAKEEIFDLMVQGGPRLPSVGGSVFFFLFMLIVLTALFHVYQKLPINRVSYFLSIILIIISIGYFEYNQIYNMRAINYMRTTNFLVYIPVAWLIVSDSFKKAKNLILITAGFLIYEMAKKYFLDLPPGTGYSRGFVVFGSISVFVIINNFNTRKNIFISVLSKYALGIYALQKFVLLFVISLFNSYGIYAIVIAGGFRLELAIQSMLCILIIGISIFILKWTPLKVFIR